MISQDPRLPGPQDLPGVPEITGFPGPRISQGPRDPRPQDLPGPRISEIFQGPRIPEIPGSPRIRDPWVPSRRAKPPTAKFWRPVSRGQLGSAGLLLVHFLPPVAGRFPSISSHKPRKTAFDRARPTQTDTDGQNDFIDCASEPPNHTRRGPG